MTAPDKPDDVKTPQHAAALHKASESVNPLVHQVIAEQDIARQNGESDVVAAKSAELAELGYE